MDAQPRILFIKLSSIGDVVHTLPALVALRRHYPQAYIAGVVEEKSREVFLEHPLLDEVFVFERDRWCRDFQSKPKLPLLREARDFARLLRSRRFDIAIDFQGMMRSGVLAWLSGAPVRVGFAHTRELNWLFMNRKIACDRSRRHAVEAYLDLVRSLGAEGRPADTLFPVTEAARATAAAFLRGHGVKEGDLLIAFNPSASHPAKCWLPERYAAVGDALGQEWGARVILFGSPADVPMIEQLAARMTVPPIIAAGKTSLKELAAIAERCALVIGSDTGPMHIVAAVGTPTIGLYGPSKSKSTGPIGDAHIILQRDHCCAREQRHGPKCGDFPCMRYITVEAVLAAAARQLARQDVRPLAASLPTP